MIRKENLKQLLNLLHYSTYDDRKKEIVEKYLN